MKLSIVVPCYNEQEVIRTTAQRLKQIFATLTERKVIVPESKVYFVDDGSTDETWTIIRELCKSDNLYSGIKLSINQGHQNALLAGLFTSEGDAIISIDADLQDDVNVIENMVNEFRNGIDIVYGVRDKRDEDTLFKKVTALLFYKIMKIMGVDIVYNHADFRLMSRRAVECLKEFKEVNLFLRGIVRLIGYKSSIVYYQRASRFAGKSKYPLNKMIGFALNGITSFSAFPLRIISFIGYTIFICTIIMSIWVLAIKLFTDKALPGWASTVLPLYFIGGVQILCLGVIGEYLNKTYKETKARPRFFIEEII